MGGTGDRPCFSPRNASRHSTGVHPLSWCCACSCDGARPLVNRAACQHNNNCGSHSLCPDRNRTGDVDRTWDHTPCRDPIFHAIRRSGNGIRPYPTTRSNASALPFSAHTFIAPSRIYDRGDHGESSGRKRILRSTGSIGAHDHGIARMARRRPDRNHPLLHASDARPARCNRRPGRVAILPCQRKIEQRWG